MPTFNVGECDHAESRVAGFAWVACDDGLVPMKKRRGRESNPRIAVLQTATLPLGYPAGGVRNERNARVHSVNVARQLAQTNVIGAW